MKLTELKTMAKTNKLLLGLRQCFRIVRGYTEISVFLFKRECYDCIRGFIFHLANVPRHKILLINLKFCELNQFSNIRCDLESTNEHLIVCLTL